MLTLADNGKTDYVISVAPDAPAVEKNAAQELASYLKKISGASFPIVKSTVAARRRQIAVGPDAAIAAGALKRPPAGLGDEGFLVRTVSKHLILTGGKRATRGTLYAVYSFIEEQLGCRWWTPKVESIPRMKTVEIPVLKKRFVPTLEYREALYRNTHEHKWAAHNRTNANEELTEKWGGHHVYKGFCHTFYELVPPEKHFQEHPDWYSEINGKRTHEAAQLCLTNPELIAFVIKRVKEWLRETPEATILSLSPNDTGNYCRCRQCRALDRKEGTPAGSLIHFVNAVAEAIEKEFPHVAVDTLAYSYSRKPPKQMRPRPNVIVRLCSYECDFLHPFTHVNNRAFRKDIEKWAKICNRLYIWDYVTNFENFVQPHPNWYVLGENIRFFIEHNVKGIFDEGNYLSTGGEMSELRAWVLAKLMWDPSRNTGELIREFLCGYYGRAATHIDAYMRLIHRTAMAIEYYPGSYLMQRCWKKLGLKNPAKAGCYLDLGATCDAPFLAPDVLLESLRHLEAAENAVKGDDKLVTRVRLAELPVWYVILMRWNEIRRYAKKTKQEWLLPNDRTRTFQAFARIYNDNGMTQLAENKKHNLLWLKKVCSGKVPL